MIFPDQDSTNFPLGVKNNLNEIKTEYSDKDFLRYHQFIVKMYMIKNTKIRGLMLFHDMGMGKSISAVAIAEYYREHDPDRNIIILLSKSLQENFKKNIKQFIKETKDSIKEHLKSSDLGATTDVDKIIDEKYKFVSLNASNMYEQLTRIDKTSEELIFENQIKEFAEIIEKSDFLENSLLIIDEFHNLSNAITNGSKNAMRLYDRIMQTKNIKLLFLTGTPIINHPFELVPTFNMLRGLISIDSRTSTTLFPELQKDFDMYFIDYKKNTINNKDRFQNRIFGLCSYYGNLYFGTKKEGFPEELPVKVVRVPMSAFQFSRYNAARDAEIEESAVKLKPSRSERFTSKSSISSSYRVKSRQISNYMIPEYALGPIRGMKSRIKYIDKITKQDLLNTDMYSPKFGKIIENLKIHGSQLGLIYSEFVSGEGIAILAKILELHGYKSWQSKNNDKEEMEVYDLNMGGAPSDSDSCIEADSDCEFDGGAPSGSDSCIEADSDCEFDGGAPKKKKIASVKKTENKKTENKTYAIISGDITIEERTKIVNTFNTASVISLLLISKTGAEGLDLKRIRHIHIMEPYWNAARQEQIIARGVRYLSHVDMPKSEQNVQTYIYLSDYPKGYDLKKKKEETTDVNLYNKSVKNKLLINQFFISLAEASLDCSIHEQNFDAKTKKEIKCKLCAVTNKKLYHPMISKDMLLPNPCESLTSSEVSAKEIDVNGEKFYYSEGENKHEFNIFKYDKEVSGYVPLLEHENPHADIMRKLLKITE